MKDGSGSRKLIILVGEHFKGLIKFCMCASACERQWVNYSLVLATTLACSMGRGLEPGNKGRSNTHLQIHDSNAKCLEIVSGPT